jgi:DnaJ-class molecular chaperone
MKRIEEQTYFEILEVSPDATAREIQRAYEHAKETFHNDSVAIYSLFSEQEIRKIQVAIEEAYRVLMEEALRKGDDQSHTERLDRQRWERPSELGEGPKENLGGREVKEVKPLPAPLSVSTKEIPGGLEGVDYRGKALKQIREKMGIDLQSVSTETRINLKILEWIEEEVFEKLPPPVYLKGFLKGYARSLGLDPAKVIDGYLRFLNGNKKK